MKKCLHFVKDGCNVRAHSRSLLFLSLNSYQVNVMNAALPVAKSLETSRPQRDGSVRSQNDRRMQFSDLRIGNKHSRLD
jgi:hypothetical protein